MGGEQETIELECEHCGDRLRVTPSANPTVCPSCGEPFEPELPHIDPEDRKATIRFRRSPRSRP